MMRYIMFCFLLLTSPKGLFSKERKVKRGESIILFTKEENPKQEVALYVNGGKKYTHIVTWAIENETITAYWKANYPMIFMDSDRNIWIANVDEYYEGTYSNNNFPSPEVELTILEPLVSSIDNGETLYTPAGKNVTITCSVSGSGTIHMDWIGPHGNTLTKNTKYDVIKYNINTGKSFLIIMDISTSDSGVYTCRATEESGSSCTVKDSIALTVYAPLTVSIDDAEILSRPLGSNVTIACSVSGYGTLSAAWMGPSGNILTSTTRHTVTSYNNITGKSTLNILFLSTNDSGSYICQATDESGYRKGDSIQLIAYDGSQNSKTDSVKISYIVIIIVLVVVIIALIIAVIVICLICQKGRGRLRMIPTADQSLHLKDTRWNDMKIYYPPYDLRDLEMHSICRTQKRQRQEI